MNQSSELKDLFSALCKAQSKILAALKDSSNPFFKSKYADLESVWGACRGPLSENGLSVSQTTEYTEGAGICIVTTLGHVSGQWLRGSLPIMPIKNDPQGIGSAITYSRRYALAAIVGVVQVDDDGEGAMNRQADSGVHPGKPTIEDGNTTPNQYRIGFGKWSQRSLEEVFQNHGGDAVASYITYLENNAQKNNKPLSAPAAEFIKEASAFLAAMEQQWATEAGSRG